MGRNLPASERTTRRSRGPAPGGRTSVLRIVQASEPGGEPLDRGLELRVGVGELLQPVTQPGQRDLLVTPALLELLDPAVGEVHRCSLAPAGPSVVLDRPVVRALERRC